MFEENSVICPVCQTELHRQQLSKIWAECCVNCGGRFITLAGLRKYGAKHQYLNTLWQEAKYHDALQGKLCPHCKIPMRKLNAISSDTTKIELDLCVSCQALWLDAGELKKIPKAPVAAQIEELPQRAKEILALNKTQALSEQAGTSAASPDSFWKVLPALFGLPVEQSTSSLAKKPWITWGIAAFCTIIFIITLPQLDKIIENFGFIPAESWRYGGLTIFSSSILHASVSHLLGNMYMLLIFGDDVESFFGHLKYLFIIILSMLAAIVCHSLWTVRPDIPCVGASGFISGIIGCYTVLFPSKKLSFLCKFFWVSCPAWLFTLLWSAMQLIGTLTNPNGSVAYSAHLGGMFWGIFLALAIKIYKKISPGKRNSPKEI